MRIRIANAEYNHRGSNSLHILVIALRNQRMFELGWDVMRFWVFEIRDDVDNCIARIKHWVDSA